MTDKSVSEQVQEGVERALAHADPATRLAHAKAGMTDAIRKGVDHKRREREASIMQRVYGPRWQAGTLQIGDVVDDIRVTGLAGDTAYLADGSTRTISDLKRR